MLINFIESIISRAVNRGQDARVAAIKSSVEAGPRKAGTISVGRTISAEGKLGGDAALSVTDRKRHLYVLGATGTGKSNLLLRLLESDIEAGRSFCVIDLRGDLVDRILIRMAQSKPANAWADDLVLLDLRDEEHVVGFNPLAGSGDVYGRALHVLAILRQQSESWGVQLEETLGNSLIALATGGHGLLDVEPLLCDQAFRARVIGACTDEYVRRFFARFDQLSADQRKAGHGKSGPDRILVSKDDAIVRRSRFTAKAEAGLILQACDVELMTDLFLHRVMSRSQIQEMHFASVARCNNRLRQLFDHGYVSRYYLPGAPFGSQALYSLGKSGAFLVASTLRERGWELDASDVRSQCCRPVLSLLKHTLAIADIYIAVRLAVVGSLDIEWDYWLPERLSLEEFDMRRKDTGGSRWRSQVFRPDGFFRLTSSKGARPSQPIDFFVEADLGHTNSTQFAGKSRTHKVYEENGLYARRYGGAGFRTLVVTTGNGRVRNLVALAERERCELFWFTTFSDLKADALGEIWTVPDKEVKVGIPSWTRER